MKGCRTLTCVTCRSKPDVDGPKIGKSLSELGATLLFEKVLTTSDANGQGRIVVPKASMILLM